MTARRCLACNGNLYLSADPTPLGDGQPYWSCMLCGRDVLPTRPPPKLPLVSERRLGEIGRRVYQLNGVCRQGHQLAEHGAAWRDRDKVRVRCLACAEERKERKGETG